MIVRDSGEDRTRTPAAFQCDILQCHISNKQLKYRHHECSILLMWRISTQIFHFSGIFVMNIVQRRSWWLNAHVLLSKCCLSDQQILRLCQNYKNKPNAVKLHQIIKNSYEKYTFKNLEPLTNLFLLPNMTSYTKLLPMTTKLRFWRSELLKTIENEFSRLHKLLITHVLWP